MQNKFVFLFLYLASVVANLCSAMENVQNKLYPKKGRFEVNAPLGMVLNQSYIDTVLLGVNATYYWQERLGLQVEFLYASNTDKVERECLENFYNDFEELIGASCPAPGQAKADPLLENNVPIKGANFGPAYVAIRELDYLVSANLAWNPIYGKQIAMFSFTSYFDLYINTGLGLAFSTFYPSSLFLRDGRLSRGPAPDNIGNGCPSSPGVCPDDPNVESLIGINGRPDSESHISPMFNFALGQRFHFLKKLHFKTELLTQTLLGVESGFESYVSVVVGAGFRW